MPFFSTSFGNPSSVHRYGQQAEAAVESARETVASILIAAPLRSSLPPAALSIRPNRAGAWPARSRPHPHNRAWKWWWCNGGGRQMTRYLAERGVESRFVNGLRVTTPATLDAVLKVFAGTVNHELVASLNRAGALAVGLSGIDALLAEAEQMDPELGAVGRVTKSNAALLTLLTATGMSPWWRAWPATGRGASTT